MNDDEASFSSNEAPTSTSTSTPSLFFSTYSSSFSGRLVSPRGDEVEVEEKKIQFGIRKKMSRTPRGTRTTSAPIKLSKRGLAAVATV